MGSPPQRAEASSEGTSPQQAVFNQEGEGSSAARPIDIVSTEARSVADDASSVSSSPPGLSPNASVFVPSTNTIGMTMSGARPSTHAAGTFETVSLTNQQRITQQQQDPSESLAVPAQQSTRSRSSLAEIVQQEQNADLPVRRSELAALLAMPQGEGLGLGFGPSDTGPNLFASPPGHGASNRRGFSSVLPPQFTNAPATGTYSHPQLHPSSDSTGALFESTRSIPTTRAPQGPQPISTTVGLTSPYNAQQRQDSMSMDRAAHEAGLERMQRQLQEFMAGPRMINLPAQSAAPSLGRGTEHGQQFSDAVRRMSGLSLGNPRPASVARERLPRVDELGAQYPQAPHTVDEAVRPFETQGPPSRHRSYQAPGQRVRDADFIPIEVSRGLYEQIIGDPNLRDEANPGLNGLRPGVMIGRPRSPIPVARGVEELQLGLEVRRQQYEEKLRDAMAIKLELQSLRSSLDELANVSERLALFNTITASIVRAEDDCRKWREKAQQIDQDINLLQNTVPRTFPGYRAADPPPARTLRDLRMFSSPVLGQAARGGAVRVRGRIPSFSPTTEQRENIEALSRSVAQLDAQLESLRRGRAVSAAAPQAATGYHSRSARPAATGNNAMEIIGQLINTAGNAITPEGSTAPARRSSDSGPRNASSRAPSFSFDDGV